MDFVCVCVYGFCWSNDEKCMTMLLLCRALAMRMRWSAFILSLSERVATHSVHYRLVYEIRLILVYFCWIFRNVINMSRMSNTHTKYGKGARNDNWHCEPDVISSTVINKSIDDHSNSIYWRLIANQHGQNEIPGIANRSTLHARFS